MHAARDCVQRKGWVPGGRRAGESLYNIKSLFLFCRGVTCLISQRYNIRGMILPQFSDRLNANAPPGLAPAAKPLRVSLADYAAGGQYV